MAKIKKVHTDLKRLRAMTDADIRSGVARDPDTVPNIANLEGLRRVRGPQVRPKKQQVTLRLSQPVIEHFKAGGRGWQSRLDDYLMVNAVSRPVKHTARAAAKKKRIARKVV